MTGLLVFLGALFSILPALDATLPVRLENELVASARRLGATGIVFDERLTRATKTVLASLPPSGRPASAMVQAALWREGIVEPTPHMIVATADIGDDVSLVKELEGRLGQLIPGAHYSRMAVAVRQRGLQNEVLVALEESFIVLPSAPALMASTQPLGRTAAIAGQLRAPYGRPEVFVTSPRGQVVRLAVQVDKDHFLSRFVCDLRGRFQIEVVGEDRFGTAVLANFPLYCGVAPFDEVAVAARSGPDFADAPRSIADAEAEIARLINRDRAQFGVAPLALDANLSAVARAHSSDMREHHYIGHISPTSGNAGERLRRAHIEAAVVLENIAREHTPAEVERGLMDSPGHRKNLLDPNATRLGVGAVLDDESELIVTQLMVRPPDRLTGDSSKQLIDRILVLRKARGLPPVAVDSDLSAIAKRTVDAWVARSLSAAEAGALCNQEVAHLGRRFASARSVVENAGLLAELADDRSTALYENNWDTFGLGIAQGARNGVPMLFAVLVLAKRR